jgi:hypothetical protein
MTEVFQSRGIDLSIFKNFGSGEDEITKGLRSGIKFKYSYSDNELNIRPLGQEADFYFESYAYSPQFFLVVRTKENGVHFPDLFATELVIFTLYFYTQRGVDLPEWRASWSASYDKLKDNWLTFSSLLPNKEKSTQEDYLYAVFRTWTGLLATNLDYKYLKKLKIDWKKHECDVIFSQNFIHEPLIEVTS